MTNTTTDTTTTPAIIESGYMAIITNAEGTYATDAEAAIIAAGFGIVVEENDPDGFRLVGLPFPMPVGASLGFASDEGEITIES